MKRFLAIVAFIAGGFAAELAHPLHCTLLPSVQRRRVGIKRCKV